MYYWYMSKYVLLVVEFVTLSVVVVFSTVYIILDILEYFLFCIWKYISLGGVELNVILYVWFTTSRELNLFIRVYCGRPVNEL